MRMEQELAGEDMTRFNLKKGRGGLVDIEFLTQMLQLTYGHRFPNLRRRGTLEALQALYRKKILKRDDYRLLSGGYLFLRRLDHRLRLERDQSIDAFEAEPGRLDGIARALGYSARRAREKRAKSESGEKLLNDYRVRRRRSAPVMSAISSLLRNQRAIKWSGLVKPRWEIKNIVYFLK